MRPENETRGTAAAVTSAAALAIDAGTFAAAVAAELTAAQAAAQDEKNESLCMGFRPGMAPGLDATAEGVTLLGDLRAFQVSLPPNHTPYCQRAF